MEYWLDTLDLILLIIGVTVIYDNYNPTNAEENEEADEITTEASIQESHVKILIIGRIS
ncbi:MAG: hypothetical protein LZ173_09660 [Thaumarchaeota archaeon]|nr:hypothetical protein [Candidatus Geocrenenecus arthurdayi]MCL7390174.1 hypothetical protein [Candidatus Geocrenenecus arthurdayi]